MERRELFRIIGATAISAELGLGQHTHGVSGGGLAYNARVFNAEQLAFLNQLCEIILPSDDESPGAGKANVALYLDMFAGFGGTGMQRRFTDGLAMIDRMSKSRFNKTFVALSPGEQDAVIAELASREADDQDAGGRFFKLLKTQTILGYHYSDIGAAQYMGYKGNTGVPEFPGCTHDGQHAD